MISSSNGIELNENKMIETSTIPTRLINVLLLIMLVLISGLLAIFMLVQRPDKVEGRFNIYSSNIPQVLISNSEGQIYFIKKNKCQVEKNSVVAFIKSTGDINQILKLQELIRHGNLNIILTQIGNYESYNLGEVSSYYNELLRIATNYRDEKEYSTLGLEIDKNINEKEKLSNSIITQETNIEIENEKLKLLHQSYKDDSLLYIKKAITKSQYISSLQTFLNQRSQLKQAKNQLVQLKKSFVDINEDNSIAKQKNAVEIEEMRNSVVYALKALDAAIVEWKKKYMIISPVNGVIEYRLDVENGHKIQAGSEVCTIIPRQGRIKGIISYPVKNSSKIKIGLPIRLYLDNYDEKENGFLVGTLISKLSSINQTTNGDYINTGSFSLDTRNQPNFKGQLKFEEGMTGRFAIIIKRKSLLANVLTWLDSITE